MSRNYNTDDILIYLEANNYNKCKCGNHIFYPKQTYLLKNKIFGITSLTPVKYTLEKEYTPKICKECLYMTYPQYKDKKIPINMYSANVITYLYALNDIEKPLFQKQQNHVHTYDNFITRYGVIEGNKRWNVYVNKHSIKNTFLFKQLKYGWNEQQFLDFNKKRAVTLDNLVKKHGEEKGNQVWNGYIQKQKVNGVTLDYFVSKYGIEKGTEFYTQLNKKKAVTLENQIIKYGVVEGNIRYQKILKNRRDQMVLKNGVSNAEDDFLKKLICLLPNVSIKYQYPIYTNGHHYFVDFCLNDKIVVEFYGQYWHASKRLYHENEKIKFPNGIFTAKEIWVRDEIRKLNIEKVGYIVLEFWEDFNSHDEMLFFENLKKLL